MISQNQFRWNISSQKYKENMNFETFKVKWLITSVYGVSPCIAAIFSVNRESLERKQACIFICLICTYGLKLTKPTRNQNKSLRVKNVDKHCLVFYQKYFVKIYLTKIYVFYMYDFQEKDSWAELFTWTIAEQTI